MAKSHIEYYKRVVFPPGQQQIFLEEIQNKLKWGPNELSNLVSFSARSIRDWRRGKYSMPLSAIEKICRVAQVSLPQNIEIKDPFWYTAKAA